MSSSFEKSVKGATKIKLAPPKSKYIEHILVATHAGESGVAEVFRALQHRLRDSTWTIVFKSLIVVHLLIREGAPDVTLRHLSKSPQRSLAINNFTEVQTQGRNIKTYAEYLLQRAVSYGATKCDYVRVADDGRLKKLTVEKGLLRETEALQNEIRALLRCNFFESEPENDITLTAFRFLILDLINLYHVMNEGTVNVIEHFLEMSKPDADRAVAIYKTFVKQTERVVNYLSMARHYEHATRLEIPKMKHAPTNLIQSMEEYLKDTDFETNRRQYLVEQQNKKPGGRPPAASKPAATTSKIFPTAQTAPTAFPDAKPLGAPPASASQPNRGPAPDLIDFFESIDTNQQPMAQGQYQPQQQYANPQAQEMQYPQQTGMGGQMFGASQQQPAMTGTNPFLQMQQAQQQPPQQMQMPPQQQQQQQQIQPQYTGAGFGGYTPQPQQSMQHNTGFAPSLSSIPQSNVPVFMQGQQQQQQQAFSPAQIQPQHTSINPFRQSVMAQPTGTTVSSFQSTPTGTSTYPSSVNSQSTNPFAKPADLSAQTTGAFSPMQQQQPQAGPFSQQTYQQGSLFAQQNTQFSPQPTQNSPFAPMQQQQQQPAPLVAAPTGTNPFARAAPLPANASAPFAAASPISTTATGSINPFRQSHFVNQQTGQGWQAGPQGTIGGMGSDQFATTSIFPRPGQAQQQQQMPQGWPPS